MFDTQRRNTASDSAGSNNHHFVVLCSQFCDLLAKRGYGISLDTASLGKPFASTRGPGRGLGLFLSNASIERLGGKVMLQSHAGGGTLTTVTLPTA